MRDLWIGRAAALLLGGLCGAYFPDHLRLWAGGVLLVLGLSLALWRPRDFFGRVWRPEAVLMGASLLLGFVYGAFAGRTLPEPLVLERVEITGQVLDWNVLEDKVSGKLRVESGENAFASQLNDGGVPVNMEQGLRGQTYLLTVYPDKSGQIPGEWRLVQPGDRVRFSAHLERPEPLGTPGGLDLRLYYAVRGLSGSIYAKGDAAILAAGKPGLTWQIRQLVRSRLQAWDPVETGILEGILFGDSSRIPEAVQERYKATGVLHVFAASGSNAAFVIGLSWLLLGWAPKRIRIGGTILALLLYAGLCGWSAPIVRAAVIGSVVLTGRLGRGKAAPLRWLLLTAVILFLFNPLLIQDTGCQLSFAAAWGIIVLSPRILKWQVMECLPGILRLAAAGTLGAQAATLPILIAAFHRLSLIGFAVNVFILFILGSVFELGLIGVILSFSAMLSAPLFQVSLWLLSWTNGVLKFLAGLPLADVWVLNPGPLFGVVWYGGIGVFLLGRDRLSFVLKVKRLQLSRGLRAKALKVLQVCPWPTCRRLENFLAERTVGGIRSPGLGKGLIWYLGAAVVIILVLGSSFVWPKDLEVAMIDVGQGDAILILTPEKHALLLDCGPRSEKFDAGERVVLPYLLARGVRRLDALLITHEHQDHLGGAQAVLANIPTAWVGVPAVGERLADKEWQAGLPAGLANNLAGLNMLQAGDRIELDSGAWLDVLGPERVLTGTHSDQNNNSLVLKLNYQGQSVLLTGDMEQEEMEELAGTGRDFADTVFKQPHHGSRFSLDRPWLDAIHPQAVWISVGKNTFGHPSPEVLQYWAERQIPVYRTDESGTIRLLLDRGGAEIIPGR